MAHVTSGLLHYCWQSHSCPIRMQIKSNLHKGVTKSTAMCKKGDAASKGRRELHNQMV